VKPAEISEAGQKIYEEQLRDKLEREAMGKFVAIEVTTANYSVAESELEALSAAKTAKPDGFFYLVRVGSDGAFWLGSVLGNAAGWPV